MDGHTIELVARMAEALEDERGRLPTLYEMQLTFGVTVGSVMDELIGIARREVLEAAVLRDGDHFAYPDAQIPGFTYHPDGYYVNDPAMCGCDHPAHEGQCTGTWATMDDQDTVLLGLVQGMRGDTPCSCLH